MSVIAVMSIALVVYSFTIEPDTELAQLVGGFDLAVCVLFLIDYGRNIILAPNRLKYIFTWGLFDLAASIPAFPGLRFARLAQIVRVLRAIRSIRILVRAIRHDRRAAILSGAMAVTFGAIVIACIGVYHYEAADPAANLKTAEDIFWWAMETTSTVGYGDYYPVTTGGRAFAIVLMFVGIGLFASAAGIFADALQAMSKPMQESKRLEASLKDEILDLRHALRLHRQAGERDQTTRE